MVLSIFKKLFGAQDSQARKETTEGQPPDVEAFVDYVVRALVDEPEQVVITTKSGDRRLTVNVECAKKDVGKVIGKNGKTIAAIRALANGAAGRLGKRVNVEILD